MTLIFLIFAGLISIIHSQDPYQEKPIIKDDSSKRQEPTGGIEPYQFPSQGRPNGQQSNRNQRPYDQVVRPFLGMGQSRNPPNGGNFNNQRPPFQNGGNFNNQRPQFQNGGNFNIPQFSQFPSFNRNPNPMQTARQGNNNFPPRLGSSLPGRDRQYNSPDDSEDYYSMIHDDLPMPSPQRGNGQPRRDPGTFKPQPKPDNDFDYYDSQPAPKKSQAARGPIMIYQPGVGYVDSRQYEQSRLHAQLPGPSSMSLQSAPIQSTGRNNKIPNYDYNPDYNHNGNNGANGITDDSCPTRSGMYGDPSSGCQHFYTCQSDGRKDTGKCPDSTKFNNKVGVCDYAYKIDDKCNPLPGFEEQPAKKQKTQYEMTDSVDDYQQPQYGTNGNRQSDYYEQ